MALYSFFILLAIISASFHIYYDNREKRGLTYIFKPLTLILIILSSLISTPFFSDNFKLFIILGLLFSLIGDIFLMFKKNDLFIKGLVSFAIAHLLYITAVISEVGFSFNIIIFTLVFCYLFIFTSRIIGKAGSKKYYVLFYSIIIGVLLYLALFMSSKNPSVNSYLFAFGILLFTISDSILAYNKFVKKFSFAQFYILITYYMAQIFIASSI